MRGGKLRRVITIQQNTPVQGTNGEMADSWADFATVHAALEPLNGREQLIASQINAQLTMRIRIRYLAGVSSRMRVLYGARTLSVQTVVNINERNREMELTCVEHET